MPAIVTRIIVADKKRFIVLLLFAVWPHLNIAACPRIGDRTASRLAKACLPAINLQPLFSFSSSCS